METSGTSNNNDGSCFSSYVEVFMTHLQPWNLMSTSPFLEPQPAGMKSHFYNPPCCPPICPPLDPPCPPGILLLSCLSCTLSLAPTPQLPTVIH